MNQPPGFTNDTDLITYPGGITKDAHRYYCPDYAKRHGIKYDKGNNTACGSCLLKYKEKGIDKCNSYLLDD
jgi:hypothetical protein